MFSSGGTPLIEGQPLLQPDLAATLTQLRVAGVGDFYTGALAQRIEQASPLAGGPIALSDLRAALPRLAPAIVLPYRNDKVAFLPPPADGGLAAAAGFMVLQHDPNALGVGRRRARWRSRRAGGRAGVDAAGAAHRLRPAGGAVAAAARLHQLRHAG